jgi:hypothetical protein
MVWKPMSQESEMSIDLISPVSANAASKVHLTLEGNNIPDNAVVWMYWHGQPVIKAKVTDRESSGSRTVLRAEVDLEGWEPEDDITLQVLVGSSDGSQGGWSGEDFVLKAA